MADPGMTLDEARAQLRDAILELRHCRVPDMSDAFTTEAAEMLEERTMLATSIAELVSFIAQTHAHRANNERRREKIRSEYLAIVRSTQAMLASMTANEREKELLDLPAWEYCKRVASQCIADVYGRPCNDLTDQGIAALINDVVGE